MAFGGAKSWQICHGSYRKQTKLLRQRASVQCVFGLWPWNRSRRKHQKWIVMNVKRATLSLLYALLLLRHWHQYNILSVLALPSRKCHTHFMFIFVNIYIRTCVGKTFDIWCVYGMKTCLAQCKCHRIFYYIHENNK